MNLDRLHDAEAAFFGRYPGGFADPDLVAVRKRHNVDRLSALARECFPKQRFARPGAVVDDVVRIIGRSSMVSMFEKPKFRDFVAGLDPDDRDRLGSAVKQLLHGRGGSPRKGFEAMVELLLDAKLAKWSLVSAVPYYYHPQREIFMKPNTVKGIVATFGLDVPPYRACPYWEFYAAYREQMLALRAEVSPELAPNNAAFSGFLMMSLDRA